MRVYAPRAWRASDERLVVFDNIAPAMAIVPSFCAADASLSACTVETRSRQRGIS